MGDAPEPQGPGNTEAATAELAIVAGESLDFPHPRQVVDGAMREARANRFGGGAGAVGVIKKPGSMGSDLGIKLSAEHITEPARR